MGLQMVSRNFSCCLVSKLKLDLVFGCLNFTKFWWNSVWYKKNSKGYWTWLFAHEESLLAVGSFDLPTSGLWAQHASTAPSCLYSWSGLSGSSHIFFSRFFLLDCIFFWGLFNCHEFQAFIIDVKVKRYFISIKNVSIQKLTLKLKNVWYGSADGQQKLFFLSGFQIEIRFRVGLH